MAFESLTAVRDWNASDANSTLTGGTVKRESFRGNIIVAVWRCIVPLHLTEWEHISIGQALDVDAWQVEFIPRIGQDVSQVEAGNGLQSSSTISSPVIDPFHDIEEFYQYSKLCFSVPLPWR